MNVMPKTQVISHPGSPSSNSLSPTETEFGHTPIDASFGDRIEGSLPPDRPLPDRPRLGAGQQRSRSGTASQVEIPARVPEEKMDKYSLGVGVGVRDRDNGYDSDAEADDEFERSELGILSPNEAEHYDDDQSDHPSESEEEHSLPDGEDTPTTQGWGDREGRSPAGKITQWNEEQVADYIASLGPSLRPYGQTFAEELVNGEALVALRHDELKELGVNSLGHRLTILKSVYELKIRSGVKIEEDDYIPLSAEGDQADLAATQDDITRVIESIKLRDQRLIAAEMELRQMKQDLDRISEENRKLREETLPIMRLVKDQRTPLPDPSGGTSLPSPREANPPTRQQEESKEKPSAGSSLSRKFSTKKLFLSGPKQPSPTYAQPPPREVRDDTGTHLEASAAAVAASSHLTASMSTAAASPSSLHNQQLSPTSPYSAQAPSSGGSYHHPGTATSRSFQRDPVGRAHASSHAGDDGTGTGYSVSSQWSQASTVVPDSAAASVRATDRERRRGQPSPREAGDDGSSTRERDRPGASSAPDNPQVEIFKSFRVSIEDPCRVVLPVALKRYNIQDDWRQYALYIVHGDQERCLGLEEKPLLLFKQLDKEGRKPMFMLRRHAAPVEGWSNSASGSGGGSGGGGDSGGGGQGGSGGKQIPGGVL